MISNVAKFFTHKMPIKSFDNWHPFLSVFYLTYACDFKCRYCSDGKGNPYHTLPQETMSIPQVIETITAIRKYCDYLVITGGEPLQYPHVDDIWSEIKKLKFKEVVLTTNGYDLRSHLPAMADTITQIVFSVDTLNAEHADDIYGVGQGTFERIRQNIEWANLFTDKRFKIVISTVLTPGYIQEAYDVYEWCKQNGWEFAACPQLVGVKAHAAFQNHAEYQEFYNFLLDEKKKRAQIFGTTVYLEYMRDLKKFNCHPFTMLVVSPLGQVFYPCLELGHEAGRLADFADLHQLRKHANQQFGPQPRCDNRCHSACALSLSTLLNNTSTTLLKELFPKALSSTGSKQRQ